MTIDRAARTATFTVRGRPAAQPHDIAAIEAAGATWYPLALARELEDAILWMRTNELDIGVWLIRTEGDPAAVVAMDATLEALKRHWLVRETDRLSAPHVQPARRHLAQPVRAGRGRLVLRRHAARTRARLRPHLPPGFARRAGARAEDRRRRGELRRLPDGHRPEPARRRFYDETPALEAVQAKIGELLDAAAAFALGLATRSPDDIDWSGEVRLAVEERVSMSPDALTALEANLRFDGPETLVTRVFGRLTAWQNWIFQRPNAVGEKGALKVYGKGEKAAFDWNRV